MSLTSQFNSLSASNERKDLLRMMFGSVGENCYVTPPFNMDYGCFISMGNLISICVRIRVPFSKRRFTCIFDNFLEGNNVYMNFGCVILDCNYVSIGNDVKFGPNVHLYAATHPTDPQERREGKEFSRPITIGDNVWLGGSTVICPGVKIGENTTIGAGSVVTKDIPPYCVAAGNPCRVIRLLQQKKEGEC